MSDKLKMTACRVHEFGPPEIIRTEQIVRPVPGEGEVLIKVKAAGVGPWDGWIRSGKSALPQPLPLTLGSDLAGIGRACRSCSSRIRAALGFTEIIPLQTTQCPGTLGSLIFGTAFLHRQTISSIGAAGGCGCCCGIGFCLARRLFRLRCRRGIRSAFSFAEIIPFQTTKRSCLLCRLIFDAAFLRCERIGWCNGK